MRSCDPRSAGQGSRLGGPAAAQQSARPCRCQAQFPSEPPHARGRRRDFKVPEPKRFTLDNGLQVALVQWGNMPKVRVTLSMRTGNAFEKADEVWLADLTGDLIARRDRDAHRDADLARKRRGWVGR